MQRLSDARPACESNLPQRVPARVPAAPSGPVPHRLPYGLPLTRRTARLLTSGDVRGRYAHGGDDDDRRVVCAIVFGAVNHGWTFEHLWHVLAERPYPGGLWVRRMSSRRGEGYARDKLRRIYDAAHVRMAESPAYSGRADVAGELAEIADLIDQQEHRGRAGATNHRLLLAHMQDSIEAGSLRHSASYRQLARRAGIADSTCQAAHDRLGDTWWTREHVPSASDGAHDATVWRWRTPAEIRARLGLTPSAASVSGTPPRPPAQQVRGVPETRASHLAPPDGRLVAALMDQDAFHGQALGAVGLRVLAALDLAEGTATGDVAATTGVHPSTVRKRVGQLVRAGLVRTVDGLHYLHPDVGHLLAQPHELAQALQPDADAPAEAEELIDRLARTALLYGTHGAGAHRAWQHQEARRKRAADLGRLTEHRSRDERGAVRAEHIDPATGLGIGEMRGWDCRDPLRPVWRGDLLGDMAIVA